MGQRPGIDAVIPRGDTVATYASYAEAQDAVKRLSQAEFPVKQVSIVGEGLTSVERVTGSMSYGRAAGAGALSGAWFGLFLGLLFIMFNPALDLIVAGAAILIGAGFGMMFAIVSYAIGRRRRDFTSVMQVVATSYALIVDPEVSSRATQILQSRTGEE